MHTIRNNLACREKLKSALNKAYLGGKLFVDAHHAHHIIRNNLACREKLKSALNKAYLGGKLFVDAHHAHGHFFCLFSGSVGSVAFLRLS